MQSAVATHWEHPVPRAGGSTNTSDQQARAHRDARSSADLRLWSHHKGSESAPCTQGQSTRRTKSSDTASCTAERRAFGPP
eukprot:scaffold300170_cov30-Tisochrysis_lutea.AAC.2